MTRADGMPIRVMICAVAAMIFAGMATLAFQADRRQRALVASGNCTLIMETLYTPPPSAHTSCHGQESRTCSTWYSQADPYMRSLWRCPDPDRGGANVEFWRRSADRGAW